MAEATLSLALASLHETRAVGTLLGGALRPGAIVLLFGELGSGKTTFAKAICEGLGIAPENVISPTYTLVNIYPGTPAVHHVDFFRIERPEALLELDRSDWIDPGGISLIEWPEKALPLLEGEAVLQARLSVPPHDRNLRQLVLRDEKEAYGPVFASLASRAPRQAEPR
ncbi:MAG: tRNA (adenosine(37)-N6)-threonylcarbamoyltransferase complex ATPase subunit type 1 TsaE [bacterium]